jgi:hypothetical protein
VEATVQREADVQATEQTIRQVVQEVLSQLTGRAPAAPAAPAASARWGVFDNVDDAVAAAQQGFEQLSRASLEQRRTAIDIVSRRRSWAGWSLKRRRSVVWSTRLRS